MGKNYEVYFHVNDNDVTYPHNDSMLVGAENPDGIMQEFKRRIDEEFDYNFSDIDFDSLEVYDDTTKELIAVSDISDYQSAEENNRKNDCIELD